MEVHHRVLLEPGHSIELGQSSWDETEESVRNRYTTASGGFSPRQSSELPIRDVKPIVGFLANQDKFSRADCLEIIEQMVASLKRLP
jgi:hypothetical protein